MDIFVKKILNNLFSLNSIDHATEKMKQAQAGGFSAEQTDDFSQFMDILKETENRRQLQHGVGLCDLE